MTRLKALRDLRAAVQDDDPLKTWRIPLNADLIETALADDDEHWSNFCGAYSGSLTDAVALAEGMLPKVDWNLWTGTPLGKEYVCRLLLERHPRVDRTALSYAPTPARAMLLATLDAMIEREGENG